MTGFQVKTLRNWTAMHSYRNVKYNGCKTKIPPCERDCQTPFGEFSHRKNPYCELLSSDKYMIIEIIF